MCLAAIHYAGITRVWFGVGLDAMQAVMLPTDNHVVPTRAEVIFNGSLEGSAPAPTTAPAPAP